MKLIVATSNPGKLTEMQSYLTDSGWELALKPPELDVEETGDSFLANARLKASKIALELQEWAIADDSGLAVDALKGAPGIYSARYADSDAARIDRLLQELGDCPQREARFICAVAISRPDGTISWESEGICEGTILFAPQGNQGFGYDPIFYVPSEKLTFAEMSKEQKRAIGHRGKALASIPSALV
jgi:XTP/dITP diphosphohydrolase